MQDFINKFQVDDSFFNRYIELIKNVVIPYQEKILKDEISVSDKSQAIHNFKIAAEILETGKCNEEYFGMVFQDSDVAKWIEAAAYCLNLFFDEELELRCDAIIDLIGRAQWDDGYINTFFTVKEPDKRWTNLEEAHELYCAGHMMEAAVAYYSVTGKNKFLNIMCKFSDHIYQRFIEEKAEGYPGHPEIELALIKMYEATENEKYKILATHFINQRGLDTEYYEKEQLKNNWSVWGSRDSHNLEYLVANEPVRNQKKAIGHAVRAVYLYSGMADVAKYTNDLKLENACKTLWRNIIEQRMYITGGIGSTKEGEAFTADYHLPNDTAYSETCAAVGLINFGRRMLELEISSEYADVIERALYNGVLPGMSFDGMKFFYVNPLEVVPGVAKEIPTHSHVLPERPSWFACACCPPNVARLIPSLGRYAWGQKEDILYNHVFVGGLLDLTLSHKGKIRIQSSLPYEGRVDYFFEPTENHISVQMALRVPYWSQKIKVLMNNKTGDYTYEKGYIHIKGDFTKDDVISVILDMEIRSVFANSKISANSHKMAIQRGPLIYCAEGIDNNEDILSLSIKKNGKKSAKAIDTFGGTIMIECEGYKKELLQSLYGFEDPKEQNVQINHIPYFLWANRKLNEMRIWMPYV